jgi:hypothetical protein
LRRQKKACRKSEISRVTGLGDPASNAAAGILRSETSHFLIRFLLEAILVYLVPGANYETGRLKKPVTGIAFMVNADRAVGLESQLAYLRRKTEKRCIMLLS